MAARGALVLTRFVLCAVVLAAVGCVAASGDDDAIVDDDAPEEVTSESADDLTFNPCACVDHSQVRVCNGSVCSWWGPTGTRDRHYCASTGKTFYCAHYARHRCRATGYMRDGLTCCSLRYRPIPKTNDKLCVP